MFVEMVCGNCDSYLNLDSEDDSSVWTLVHRFTNAHVQCGYVTGGESPDSQPQKHKVIKPRRANETEEP